MKDKTQITEDTNQLNVREQKLSANGPNVYTKSRENLYSEVETITSKFVQEFNKPDVLFTDNQASNAFSSSQENLLLIPNKKKKQQLTKEQASLKLSLDRALERKLVANSLFRQDRFSESAIEYEKALSIFLSINKDSKVFLEQTNYQNLIIECYNNLTMCKIKIKEYNEVINITNKVFAFSKFNVKALCYRAKALYHLGSFKECLVYAKSAISLQPNQAMMQLIHDSEQKLDEEYQSVFNKQKQEPEEKKGNKEENLKGVSIKNIATERPKGGFMIIKVLKLLILVGYDVVKKNKLLWFIFITILLFFYKKKQEILKYIGLI